MSLWDNINAEKATGGKASGTWEAQRVEIDSRCVKVGDLFVAIKGERFDGHEFVNDALEKGAAAAIVSKSPHPNPLPLAGEGGARSAEGEGRLLQVHDTQKALEDLARFSRARAQAKIVGVTGSVGKTSAKEMLALALGAHGQTYATTGNFNNHIGTPLNLANLEPQTPFGVFEMGMNHAGEIAALTKMVRPHVAVITNVEAVHLEFFSGVEAIADAKAEIFEGVQEGGVAVLNADNPWFERLKTAAQKRGVSKIISCGENSQADCRLLSYRATAAGCEISAAIGGADYHYTLGAMGKHFAHASLLALGVAQALGLDIAKTARALAQYREPEGRGRLTRITISGGAATLIDDSYNASPASMRAAFAKTAEAFDAKGKKGRKIAALGNMLELGENAPALHAALAEDLKHAGFDLVFTAGELMRHLHDALPMGRRGGHVANAADLAPHLLSSLRADDILLIKGSHGSKIYQLAAQLTKT